MAALKFTHAHPLAGANKKFTRKPITFSIHPTFDSSTRVKPKVVLGFKAQCHTSEV
jgi:hypothetical protein